MAEIPPANELEDWLHELPPGYANDVTRLSDPGEDPWFELWHGDIRFDVDATSESAPAIRLIASKALESAAVVEATPRFEIALWQTAAATPGYMHRVDGGHELAANNTRSIVFIAPIYAGGISKHNVLNTLLRIGDAARATGLFEAVTADELGQ